MLRGRAERGFTLIEALIAVTITAGVLGLSATALISGQRAASETVARQVTSNSVQTALAFMISELRLASSDTAKTRIQSSASGTGGNTNQQGVFKKATGFTVGTSTPVFGTDINYQ